MQGPHEAASRLTFFVFILLGYSLQAGAQDEYRHQANAAIEGHNDGTHYGVTVDDCKRLCTATCWCKSFDYYKGENQCDLSSKAESDEGITLKTDYDNNPYDHYERLTSNYIHIQDKAIEGHNKPPRRYDVSVDDCKEQCSQETWCRSFDYHKADRWCDLSDKTGVNVHSAAHVRLKPNFKGNPYDHYARSSYRDTSELMCFMGGDRFLYMDYPIQGQPLRTVSGGGRFLCFSAHWNLSRLAVRGASCSTCLEEQFEGNASLAVANSCNGSPQQLWHWEGSGVSGKIKRRGDQKCLEASGSGQVYVASCDTGRQTVEFTPPQSGQFQIRLPTLDQCLQSSLPNSPLAVMSTCDAANTNNASHTRQRARSGQVITPVVA